MTGSHSSNLSFDSQAFLRTLTERPGVYRMYDVDNTVIYVGKAKNLKKRVASYFRHHGLSNKTQAMVGQIHHVEVTVTHTEAEALLMENNLIKEQKPRYNILLRDDKSYPYIFLSDEEFPRLGFHRGARKQKGRYFGPFPSASAVRESLNLLQKLFPVRQCEDSYYRNRSRPCLQYQIKRCTAPCVGLISSDEYHTDVKHASMFLEGRDSQVIDDLVLRMDAAASTLEYEKAARYRDQIANLRRVQERQYVMADAGDLDMVVAGYANGVGCVQVFFIRAGRNLGNKTFFPQHTGNSGVEEIISAFLTQFYLGTAKDTAVHMIPVEILINSDLPDKGLLSQVLSQQAGHPVALSNRLRGDRLRWLNMAETNVKQALQAHLASKANMQKRFEKLQDALGLEELPLRIECFDISHTMGEATVASCVVFNLNGAAKSDYRRYNIEGITPGDDYAAMNQALKRRFGRLKNSEGKVPDILLIDGGKGQVSAVEKVLAEFQIPGITLVGVAKGPSRKPGLEQLILSGQQAPIILPGDSPALHLIQQVRDEAHRFAITGHRQRRGKARRQSPLEGITGLGPKRRQLLLRQFGGLQELARAGIEDISRINGISQQLAKRIYDALHTDKSGT